MAVTGSHVIDTRLGALGVKVVGEGPPALLWHSLFVDSGSWSRIEDTLANERTLVLVSGPGHGGNGDPGRRYTIDECADAAIEVLDHLGIADRVDWVGNAWGGHVGIVAACHHTARLRSLVTISAPVAALTEPERRRMRFLVIALTALGPVRFLRSGVAKVLLSSTTRASDAEALAYVDGVIGNADRRRLTNAIESISLGRQDLTPLLDHIRIPTLIITGSADAGFTPEQATAAGTSIPGGTVAIVDEAAYLPPVERPDETAAMIVDFWRRVAAAVEGRSDPGA